MAKYPAEHHEGQNCNQFLFGFIFWVMRMCQSSNAVGSHRRLALIDVNTLGEVQN